MVGGIVQYQDQALARIVPQRQLLQEGDESLAVLLMVDAPGNLTVAPVVSPEDVDIFRRSRCRNELALAAFLPAAAQRRVDAHGRFVHKEEFDGRDGMKRGVFFSQSSTSLATA